MIARLPPLNSIRVFAVVAQNLNFARAAEELGVTQSAVSKQIQSLEDYVGTKLFERKAQGVELTSEGRELREAVLPAIERLTHSFERYARRPPRSTVVRVTTTASFASLVLLPALGDFEDAHADIVIEILAGDRLFGLDREEVDFAIRFGPGPWPEGAGEKLGSQTLSLVVSPQLLAYYGGDSENLLKNARRIQIFGKNEWMEVPAWIGVNNEHRRPNLMLENFHVAACAARLGQGFALLPSVLLKDELEKGNLVNIGATVPWTEGFNFLEPVHRSLSPPAKIVANWVKELAS